MLILIYDTETTGLPDWKSPSDSDNQPHIVQLAAVLYDTESKEVLGAMDVIIKPDGWTIPEEVSAIHGITTEQALKVGIPEIDAVKMLLSLRGEAVRVAHNKTFDQRIVRIACKRFLSEEETEKWAEKDDHHCSMFMAQKIIGGKVPKLADAYKFFTGNELENAHSAMPDTLACLDVYLGVLAHGAKK